VTNSTDPLSPDLSHNRRDIFNVLLSREGQGDEVIILKTLDSGFRRNDGTGNTAALN